MRDLSILVLAAGMGSRYGGLKQLEPVGPNNETLLDYSVYDAIQTGFNHIVFIIRKDIEQAFRESIGKRYEHRIRISYAFQELNDLPDGFTGNHRAKPWGTAHALYAARKAVDGCFAVINADDFYGRKAYALLAEYFQASADSEKMPFAMVGYPLKNTLSTHGSVNRGLCKAADGWLLRVEEITDIALGDGETLHGLTSADQRIRLDPQSPVSMNFWGLSDRIFPLLEEHLLAFLAEHKASPAAEFYIPSFVDTLIREEGLPCRMLESDGNWFGVTYPADRAHVQQAIGKLTNQQVYPSPLMD